MESKILPIVLIGAGYMINRNNNDQMIPNICPKIIDPNTKIGYDIKSEKGQKLMKKYLAFYFDNHLKKTKDDWNYILPSELYKADKTKFFLLDTRKPSDYLKIHIPDTVNIYWLNLFEPNNLRKLPIDKKIVIIWNSTIISN